MKSDSFDEFIQRQSLPAGTKIVMTVLDGLGGLPREPGGKTELESALAPNLNALAAQSSLGLTQPAGPGITVGSGPGHLALFGYDPIKYEIGRGVLEALGVDFEVGPHDVAARGNFCTVDDHGFITDRRAGRISTEESTKLIELLRSVCIEGVEIFLEPVKEHRFAFILRAEGLNPDLTDSDPLIVGTQPLEVEARTSGAEKTTQVVNTFLHEARKVLKGKSPANMVMLRGFAKFPSLPVFTEKYNLKAAAVAVNGMYRGVARLAGMEVLSVEGNLLAHEIKSLERNWDQFDFFYLHFKKTDTCGESGDFDGKVRAIEEFDVLLPRLLALQPDVMMVCGDHSSPSVLKAHSWHPVPFLLYSPNARPDGIREFGERACSRGSLGLIPATHVMPLALAHAGRLAKYGA